MENDKNNLRERLLLKNESHDNDSQYNDKTDEIKSNVGIIFGKSNNEKIEFNSKQSYEDLLNKLRNNAKQGCMFTVEGDNEDIVKITRHIVYNMNPSSVDKFILQSALMRRGITHPSVKITSEDWSNINDKLDSLEKFILFITEKQLGMERNIIMTNDDFYNINYKVDSLTKFAILKREIELGMDRNISMTNEDINNVINSNTKLSSRDKLNLSIMQKQLCVNPTIIMLPEDYKNILHEEQRKNDDYIKKITRNLEDFYGSINTIDVFSRNEKPLNFFHNPHKESVEKFKKIHKKLGEECKRFNEKCKEIEKYVKKCMFNMDKMNDENFLGQINILAQNRKNFEDDFDKKFEKEDKEIKKFVRSMQCTIF